MPRRSQTTGSSHTILVVDDQEETLVSVRQLLEREGYRVLTAESGERALAIFKKRDIHVLLVDYFMPRMTGEDLVREIRAFDPFVQIILQTGYSGEKPPRAMLAELDIQGYHDKAEGPERLLLWIDVALKARKVIRALRERARLQAELVANVSHEFRTPLSVITGYTEMLQDGAFGEFPPLASKPLRAVGDAIRSMHQLVTDFLAYAKVEAHAMEVSCEWVEIDEVVQELRQLAAMLLENKAVRFAVEAHSTPAGLMTDATKLRTILRNLLTNAIKFTDAGSIVLRIERRGRELRFALQDTGPGIGEHDLDFIFEPFRQIDGSTTRHHRGIGLGLSLSRKLAQLLNGSLEVESELGAGSTFTLALPAAAMATTEAPGVAGSVEGDIEVPALAASAHGA